MSEFAEKLTNEIPDSNSKIDIHDLGDRVKELIKSGNTLRGIAQALSQEEPLASQGGISYEAVRNWINKVRQEQAELRKIVAEEFWRENIGASVEALDKLADRLMKDFDRPFDEVIEDLGLWGQITRKVPMPYEMRVQLAGEIRQLVVARQKLGSGETSTGDLGALLHDLDDSAGESNE